MQLVDKAISVEELRTMSGKMFNKLVKAVVDIEKEVMVLDAELHSDEELMLLENGCEQKDLWGINIYPDRIGDAGWIEFDSMINLRPSQENKSRGVEDPKIRERIIQIVTRLVTKS